MVLIGNEVNIVEEVRKTTGKVPHIWPVSWPSLILDAQHCSVMFVAHVTTKSLHHVQ